MRSQLFERCDLGGGQCRPMLGRNPASLEPRPYGMHGGFRAGLGDLGEPGGFKDVGVGSHDDDMMHYASQESKCLLHYSFSYPPPMETPAERLRFARERKYPDAKAAAEAMGARVATYIQHENGTRGIRPSVAQRYARFFGVAPDWLLFGKGQTPAAEPKPASLMLLPVQLPSEEALKAAWAAFLEATPEYPDLDPDEFAELLAQHLPDVLASGLGASLSLPSLPGQPPKKPGRSGGKSKPA